MLVSTYSNLKEKYEDALILSRSGEWYEAYYQDAKDIAEICNITCSMFRGMAFVAFPFRALDEYLPMMVRAGRRVGIEDDNKIINTLWEI